MKRYFSLITWDFLIKRSAHRGRYTVCIYMYMVYLDVEMNRGGGEYNIVI